MIFVERRTVRGCGTVVVAALSLLLHAASTAAFVTLRERPGPAARAVARRHARSSRSTRPTTGWRSSPSIRDRQPHPQRLGPGRARAGRGRRARPTREVWVVNHLSDSVSIVDVAGRRRASCARCSSATSRATSSSPARADSRAFITTAHRGQNSPAPLAAAHHARASAAPTSGSSTRRISARRSGGTPLTVADALRRHAARARRRAPTAARSTPPSSTPATRPPRSERGRRLRRRLQPPGPCTCAASTYPGRPAGAERDATASGPETGLIVRFNAGDGPLGGRARPQLGQRACASSCRTMTSSRSTPRESAGRRRRRSRSRTSARSSSTWS